MAHNRLEPDRDDSLRYCKSDWSLTGLLPTSREPCSYHVLTAKQHSCMEHLLGERIRSPSFLAFVVFRDLGSRVGPLLPARSAAPSQGLHRIQAYWFAVSIPAICSSLHSSTIHPGANKNN